MTDLPLVTVITPSFNRAELIVGTIESVAAQTYPRIEHMVVDGASTDGTAALLADYGQRLGLTSLIEPDRGMYDAINKGLARASGEILCYLNTDDRFFPWSVQAAVDHFARHPEADLIYGDTLVQNLDTGAMVLNILPGFCRAWLRSGGILPQPTVFFRRRVYETLGGFQREVQYLADCEYWLRADRAGFRIQKLHELLAIESNHSGTIRETLREAVAMELAQLRRTYSSPLFSLSLPRTVLHRLKYCEKEWLTARFFTLMQDGEPGPWQRFRQAYQTEVDLLRYYAEKITRKKTDIWKIRPRNG